MDCIVDLEIKIYGCSLFCKIPSEDIGAIGERREAIIAFFESRTPHAKDDLRKHLENETENRRQENLKDYILE